MLEIINEICVKMLNESLRKPHNIFLHNFTFMSQILVYMQFFSLILIDCI